jgi:hypothetical protein
LLDRDPLDDDAQRQLIRLHHLSGDGASALAAYRRYETRLRVELGTVPTQATKAVVQQIEAAHHSPHNRPFAERNLELHLMLRRPPMLVGRTDAWAAMDAARSVTQSMLVIGEPGIGKTRLLQDYTNAHKPSLITGSRPGDDHQPFALLTRLVRLLMTQPMVSYGLVSRRDQVTAELARLLPELGPAPETAADPAQLGWATAQFVQRALRTMSPSDRPVIVALDDLHHADDASLETLVGWIREGHVPAAVFALASCSRELPAALEPWVANAETPEGGTHSVPRALAGDEHPRSVRPGRPVVVNLRPLDADDIAALLESMPGRLALNGADRPAWAVALQRHAGGNPMFTLQCIQALHQSAGDRSMSTAALDGEFLTVPPRSRR